MGPLTAIRIPLAWFLLAMTVLAATGIVWLIASRNSAPSNAVLIQSVPVTTSPNPQAAVVPTTPPTMPSPQVLVVYISGEVVKPGVYTLPNGSRVGDVVAVAGGFTEEANREGINLAARVSDEQHISVPRVGEETEAVTGNPTSGAGETNGNGSNAGTSPGKVNINTATAKELEALPGIGEVLAQRIIAEREANGPFKSVDDLIRVPGIKEGIIAQLRDLVTVGP